MAEKTISDEIDGLFGIRNAFSILGWASMLGFMVRYYPLLVHEFYTNIEPKKDLLVHIVNTSVKGFHIHLDHATLAWVLGVVDERQEIIFLRKMFFLIKGETINSHDALVANPLDLKDYQEEHSNVPDFIAMPSNSCSFSIYQALQQIETICVEYHGSMVGSHEGSVAATR
ncbi:hypothetical protein FNV43_RR11127 [Rhamnella rubrinervis]|uniref:Uncharacterized protein n=1 Tax=Rhamnella rubrinervis TaxID=2594499 RepID=A0A8K0H5P3_9ROSA|nr:hypothetical protein FNV43_RR11127 [Rhamnella rubrinervis]